ncbi:MAG: hypothetical protein EP330_05540 [Deltaproteobacteria bacterium]|nr:MAG: hypothetical protein EP330_05540 [Deltaproteobacteria bacterium]
MAIPHIDRIRELRARLQACGHAPALLSQVHAALTELAATRHVERDDLPGDGLIEYLVHVDGLQGLAAVDAPEDAPRPARLQARELLLRSATAVLMPIAQDAQDASTELDDLRRSQLEAINNSGDDELIARMRSLHDVQHHLGHELQHVQGRLAYVTPTRNLLDLYVEKLGRALQSTAPIRDALCDTFAQTAVQDLPAFLEQLGAVETFADPSPEKVYERLTHWSAELPALTAILEAELAELSGRMTEVQAELEELLG